VRHAGDSDGRCPFFCHEGLRTAGVRGAAALERVMAPAGDEGTHSVLERVGGPAPVPDPSAP
jgi:hypothetical protein